MLPPRPLPRRGNPLDVVGRANLSEAVTMIQAARARLDRIPAARQEASRLQGVIDLLLTAARRNPQIVVFGNPRREGALVHHYTGGRMQRFTVDVTGKIADSVHAIYYEHASDHDAYQHTFESEVEGWAGVNQRREQVVVLVGAQGQPIFADFPQEE